MELKGGEEIGSAIDQFFTLDSLENQHPVLNGGEGRAGIYHSIKDFQSTPHAIMPAMTNTNIRQYRHRHADIDVIPPRGRDVTAVIHPAQQSMRVPHLLHDALVYVHVHGEHVRQRASTTRHVVHGRIAEITTAATMASSSSSSIDVVASASRPRATAAIDFVTFRIAVPSPPPATTIDDGGTIAPIPPGRIVPRLDRQYPGL